MSAKRYDPSTTFLFGFKITSGSVTADYEGGTAFFKQISGLKVDQEIQDMPEGGVLAFTRKVPGVMKWGPISLKNGFTNDPRLLNFKMKPERGNCLIAALNHDRKPICKWEIYNAIPVKWELSDFDATKGNEVLIETLDLVHEGIVMNPEKAAPPPAPPPAPPTP